MKMIPEKAFAGLLQLDERWAVLAAEDEKSLLQVSVLARECVWAEIFSTALLVANSGLRFSMVDDSNVAALTVRTDGFVTQSSQWIKFQR